MADKIQEGKEILNSLFGMNTTEGLYAFLEKCRSGSGDYWLHSYGEFYSDEVLDLKTKQLLVITTLITQKGAFLQLRNHLLGCKHAGLTKQEVVSAILHLTMYIGFPSVVNALEFVNDVYGK